MFDGLSKIFRRSDARGIDGSKPRDAYMDVLREIQSPKPARAPLSKRAAQVVARLRWGGRGGQRNG
jgi:hypothetical protein